MVSTLEYLARKHRQIRTSYGHSCYLLAGIIAKKLHDEGLRPEIWEVSEDIGDGSVITYRPLTPTLYRHLPDPPSFSKHFVACAAAQAYDPLIGRPVPSASYTRAAFGEEIPFSRALDHEEVLGRITREPHMLEDSPDPE